jgi:S-adenosylmethionine:tRNA ribosyltransferase-isomerase
LDAEKISPNLYDIESYAPEIPEELIAQNPSQKRDGCRLMRLDRATGKIERRRFAELPSILRAGDLLVFNDTRVFKARARGKKIPGGASVELFFLRREDGNVWRALVRPGRKLPPGAEVETGGGTVARITARHTGGERSVALPEDVNAEEFFRANGEVPLPPYIKNSSAPEEMYQTVYADAEKSRSVAAPTAGLHFTRELMGELAAAGVETEFITLDVGIGTFRPVKSADIRNHDMHSERCEIGASCAERVNAAKSEGRRVIAVGTTAVRTLESFADTSGFVAPGARDTDIFITPGYRFKTVDAMITNFHLPKSTLLMLVSAFAGRERIMTAYAEAVRERYRFFSFGDAMLIE